MDKIKKNKGFSKILKMVGIIVFSIFLYSSGYLVGHKNLVFEKSFIPEIASKEVFKPREIDFSMFWTTWNKINKDFIAKIDTQKMVYGAISGMVDSLNDPYTVFMDPESAKSFADDLSGSFEGIGAELTVTNKKLTIVSPLSGYPAEKAGLKPSDVILKIDNIQANTLSIYDAIAHIRGKAGSKVKLTVERVGWTEPQVIEIQREKIIIKSVEWSMKNDKVGYIKVIQFGDDTTTLMQAAAKEIADRNPQTVILDLRRNPGGYLQSAVDMVGLFAPKGSVVVKEKNKDDTVQEEKTTEDPIISKAKVIVLIDRGSASASEIVAGALQDLGRATLVGEKSFGKGSVQEMVDLGQGATLKMTIAEWLTPKDRVINHIGIEPDVNIVLTEADDKAGLDPQLDKALELAK